MHYMYVLNLEDYITMYILKCTFVYYINAAQIKNSPIIFYQTYFSLPLDELEQRTGLVPMHKYYF